KRVQVIIRINSPQSKTVVNTKNCKLFDNMVENVPEMHDKEVNEDKDLKELVEQLRKDPIFDHAREYVDIVEVAKRIRLGLEYASFKIKNGWEKYDVATCEMLFEEKMRINAIPIPKMMQKLRGAIRTHDLDLHHAGSGSGSMYNLRTNSKTPSPTVAPLDIVSADPFHQRSSYQSPSPFRLSGPKAAAIYEYLDSLELPSHDQPLSESMSSQFLNQIDDTSSLRSNLTRRSKKFRDHLSDPKRIRRLRKAMDEDEKFGPIPEELSFENLSSNTDKIQQISMFIPATSKIPEPSRRTGCVMSQAPVISETILRALETTPKKKSKKRKSATKFTKKAKSKRTRRNEPSTGEEMDIGDIFGMANSSLSNQKVTMSPNTLFNELWATASTVVPQKTAITSKSPGQLFNELWATSSGVEPKNKKTTGPESTLVSPDSFLDDLLHSSANFEEEKPTKDIIAESTQTLSMSPGTIFRTALDDWAAVDSTFSDTILSHLPHLPSSPLASSPPRTPPRRTCVPSITPLIPPSTRQLLNTTTTDLEPPRTPPHKIRSSIDMTTPNSAFSLSEFINMSPERPTQSSLGRSLNESRWT
ncbi:16620_t:CDS:2, partial [Acaulospora colombiana]